MVKRLKVTIFGAGGTGVKTAEAVCAKGNVDVVLIDIRGDLAKGRALDLNQTRALTGIDFHLVGSDNPELTKDSDIVVITAGQGRTPGVPREALLATNASIVWNIAQQTARLSPNAYLIVLTNPADLLTKIAWQASGFPTEQVMGQGGILDSARMSYFVAEELGVSPRSVHAMVLGGHGDSMIPLRHCVSVDGIPATSLLSDAQWNRVIHRTRYGGGEILSLFGTHGASATPGLAVHRMIEALQSEIPELLPVSASANGAYGIEGVFIGLPVLLSSRGVEKVMEVPLLEEERLALQRSAQDLREKYQEWWGRYGTAIEGK